MRKMMFLMAMVFAISLLATSCDPGAGNAGNKPANSANNSANNPAATSPANAAAAEADVKKALSDAAASMTKNDVEAAEKLYSDNYMFVGPDGSVATRAERIAAMKSGDTKYDSLAYDEVSVRVNPEGTGAVSISRATVKGKNMGKAVDGQYRVTHVWTKTKDGWKMASGQTTPISAAAPAKVDEKLVSNSNAAKPPPPSANK